jgi:hypothetical protein
VYGLKHQKEKRSMDHFAGQDVSVKETSVCIVDDIALGLKGYWEQHTTFSARNSAI